MADRTITTDLIGRDRSLSSTLNNAGSTAERTGGRFKSALGSMKDGALGAGAALVGLGAVAIKSASDSEQSIGATETVFGKYATTVISKSKDERDSVRLTAHEYREAANLIGAGFKNQGVAADQLAGKTSGMIQIGADLAATYGGSTKEAVEALGSAFKGEFDPMERYGVGLSAAKVQAELVRMGADKLTGSQLALATQQATTNLITRQAGGALGAAARESKTTAGQTEALQEKYGNLSAELGTKLLPILNKVLSFGVKLLEWSSKHKTATMAAAVAVGVLAGGILLLNLAMLANPVGLIVLGLAGLAAGFTALWQKSEKFRTVMTVGFSLMATVVLDYASIILKASRAMMMGVITSVSGILNAVAKIPGPTQDSAKKAARSFDEFKNGVDKTFSAAERKVGEWKSAVKKMPQRVKLQGEISDLNTKINAAKAKLKTVPKSKQATVRADISQLQERVRTAKANLASISNRNVYVTYKGIYKLGKAPGSPGNGLGVLKAKGGPVMKGQSYIVGDGGRPELFVPEQNGMILPRVPAEGAGRAWGGGGTGGDTYIINVYGNGERALGDALIRALEARPTGAKKIPRSAVA